MSEDGPSPRGKEPPQAARLAIEVMRRVGAWNDSAPSEAEIERAAQAAFTAAAPARPCHYEVAIVLTDDTEMRELNRTWRNKDEPTNVLSFPAGEAPADSGALVDGTLGDGGALGDIVIAYETTRTEADETGIALSDHASHLIVHGVLHLLGFDHLDDCDAEKMEELERQVLASLGIADPYRHGNEACLAEISR